jgi:hypothetical protein
MKSRITRLLGLVLILSALALMWSPFVTYLAVDGCLDAGGSFYYELNVCDFEGSHPYEPRDDMVRTSLACLLGLLGAALVIGARRASSPE